MEQDDERRPLPQHASTLSTTPTTSIQQMKYFNDPTRTLPTPLALLHNGPIFPFVTFLDGQLFKCLVLSHT